MNLSAADCGTASVPFCVSINRRRTNPSHDGVYRLANNASRARRWLERAAGGGDAAAQSLLGIMYLRGQYGAERSVGRAKLWLEQAAAQGHAGAVYNLG